MTTIRRWRLFYLIVIELSQKYTKALFGGFIAGLVLSLLFWKVYPVVFKPWFEKVERIGVVGEFTPSTLPSSVQREISIGLTQVNADGSVSPALASSWVATDSGKIFTFYLRGDKKWHSGGAAVASDVNYNIKSVSIDEIDSKTIKITLPTAYSPLPSLVSRPLFKSGLQGMGPYRVSAIKLKGDSVIYLKLVPAESTSNLPDKEYRFYHTESEAVLAYKMGEVDTLTELSSAYDLSHWGKSIVSKTTLYNRIVSIYFNMTNQQFQDKNFRHGLAYAIGQLPGERAYSPIAKTSWAYTEKLKKYNTDLTQSKKLLGTDPIASSSGSIVLTTFSSYAEVAQSIADSWTAVGVPTRVSVVNVVPADFQVLLSGQDIPPDPDQYPFWHSTQTQTNITGFANVKIDKLLEDGRQEIDTDTRTKIYADFQRRIVEESPLLFLYYPTVYSVSRN